MTMVEFRQVPIRDLPKKFTAAMHEQIRWFAATIVVERASRDAYSCAGTLCSISGSRGIVTARHVSEQLAREAEVLVLTPRVPVALRPSLFCPVVPTAAQRLPDVDASVPDIAFLRIPDSDCSNLEAYGKTFYSIDRRLSGLDASLYEEHGYWAVCGAPQALLDPTRGSATSLVYGTSICRRFEVGTYDYLEIDLDLDANPDIPADFQGVSGGGVWRTPFKTNEAATDFQIDDRYRDVILAGVNFWQTGPRGRRLLAHGPRSIYEHLHGQVTAAQVMPRISRATTRS